MQSKPTEKKPFSYQQAGGVSIVNGNLTVAKRANWNTTTPSAIDASTQPESSTGKNLWQMDGYIAQAASSFIVTATLSLIAKSRLSDILVSSRTGSASAALYVKNKKVKVGEIIEKGARVELAIQTTGSTEINFTIHLESA